MYTKVELEQSKRRLELGLELQVQERRIQSTKSQYYLARLAVRSASAEGEVAQELDNLLALRLVAGRLKTIRQERTSIRSQLKVHKKNFSGEPIPPSRWPLEEYLEWTDYSDHLRATWNE